MNPLGMDPKLKHIPNRDNDPILNSKNNHYITQELRDVKKDLGKATGIVTDAVSSFFINTITSLKKFIKQLPLNFKERIQEIKKENLSDPKALLSAIEEESKKVSEVFVGIIFIEDSINNVLEKKEDGIKKTEAIEKFNKTKDNFKNAKTAIVQTITEDNEIVYASRYLTLVESAEKLIKQSQEKNFKLSNSFVADSFEVINRWEKAKNNSEKYGVGNYFDQLNKKMEDFYKIVDSLIFSDYKDINEDITLIELNLEENLQIIDVRKKFESIDGDFNDEELKVLIKNLENTNRIKNRCEEKIQTYTLPKEELEKKGNNTLVSKNQFVVSIPKIIKKLYTQENLSDIDEYSKNINKMNLDLESINSRLETLESQINIHYILKKEELEETKQKNESSLKEIEEKLVGATNEKSLKDSIKAKEEEIKNIALVKPDKLSKGFKSINAMVWVPWRVLKLGTKITPKNKDAHEKILKDIKMSTPPKRLFENPIGFLALPEVKQELEQANKVIEVIPIMNQLQELKLEGVDLRKVTYPVIKEKIESVKEKIESEIKQLNNEIAKDMRSASNKSTVQEKTSKFIVLQNNLEKINHNLEKINHKDFMELLIKRDNFFEKNPTFVKDEFLSFFNEKEIMDKQIQNINNFNQILTTAAEHKDLIEEIEVLKAEEIINREKAQELTNQIKSLEKGITKLENLILS